MNCNQDSQDEYNYKKQENFEDELRKLINKFNMESDSNTPDYILSQYMFSCLISFNTATQQRETWHGRNAAPSNTRYGVEVKV